MDILSQRSKQTRDGSTLVELLEEAATVSSGMSVDRDLLR